MLVHLRGLVVLNAQVHANIINGYDETLAVEDSGIGALPYRQAWITAIMVSKPIYSVPLVPRFDVQLLKVFIV